MLTYTKDKNNEEILLDSNNEQVMMEWEKPYMEACIDFLKPKGNVLEIGFGMGYSATAIQKYKPKSYTIVECDPTVIKKCKKWSKNYDNVTIIEAKWQEVICTNRLGIYDEVFFDDFPNNLEISAYLCKGTSMYNDPTWKSKYIDNINWGYKEKIMDLNVSNTQNYHYSKTKAIIPLLIKKS